MAVRAGFVGTSCQECWCVNLCVIDSLTSLQLGALNRLEYPMYKYKEVTALTHHHNFDGRSPEFIKYHGTKLVWSVSVAFQLAPNLSTARHAVGRPSLLVLTPQRRQFECLRGRYPSTRLWSWKIAHGPTRSARIPSPQNPELQLVRRVRLGPLHSL